MNSRTIETNGLVIELNTNEGGGTVSSNFYEWTWPCQYEGNGHNAVLEAEAMKNVFESFVLAMACEGLGDRPIKNVCATVLDAISNHVGGQ